MTRRRDSGKRKGGDLFLFTHLTVRVFVFIPSLLEMTLYLFADSVLRGLRRRVGGRALGGNRPICLLCCGQAVFSLVRPWEVVLTSFHLLLSYATWLCVFVFRCLRFGFWIFYESLFIYFGTQLRNRRDCLSEGPGRTYFGAAARAAASTDYARLVRAGYILRCVLAFVGSRRREIWGLKCESASCTSV